MNLIQIQLDAIRRDELEKFRSRRPIWSKKRNSSSSMITRFDSPDREDTRTRERYPEDFFDNNPYDEPESRPPPEYPFQDFNYGP